jgi:hypothetical protein
MLFIEAKLEILKGEIASFHPKSHQVPDNSKGEKLSGMAYCSLQLEKSRTWVRWKLARIDDEVHFTITVQPYEFVIVLLRINH